MIRTGKNLCALLAVILMSACGRRTDVGKVDLATDLDSLSYAIGMSIGSHEAMNLQNDSSPVAPDNLMDGLRGGISESDDDALGDAWLRQTIAQLAASAVISERGGVLGDTLVNFSHRLFMQGIANGLLADTDSAQQKGPEANQYVQEACRRIESRRRWAQYASNREAGERFLAENARLDSVTVLESGLQYKILSEGSGRVPSDTSLVRLRYEGRFVDGMVFDATVRHGDKPTELRVDNTIQGWAEALTLMPVGSKWQLYIPYDLAYGERGAGSVKPYSALIFDVELIEIVR